MIRCTLCFRHLDFRLGSRRLPGFDSSLIFWRKDARDAPGAAKHAMADCIAGISYSVEQIAAERHVLPQLTVFDWGGYRYSNARDAIAAAKRLTLSA